MPVEGNFRASVRRPYKKDPATQGMTKSQSLRGLQRPTEVLGAARGTGNEAGVVFLTRVSAGSPFSVGRCSEDLS
jgi:hypothetical protein